MSDRTRTLKDVLWTLALAGLVAAGLRLWYGLGATTNLSDAVPWGLWKILNMVAGVAISTSGFTVGFLVYVLRIERFRPLMKPAILVAFLGYGCSCLALLFDIGLPWRFWHPFIMWNAHSFLFEVFWCVTLYFTVTAIELAPTVFEKHKAEPNTKWLHRIAFGVVIVGISLSSLHHSSLGSLFLVTPQRLHALWYSPSLPLFFILSAIGGGLMFLVFVWIVHAHYYDREAVFGPTPVERELFLVRTGDAAGRTRPTGPDMPMLTAVASIATGVLALYLLLQIYHLAHHAAWSALMAGTWESWLYAFEILVSTVLPILLVWLPGPRRSPAALTVATLSASFGLLLNRLDVGIFGYFRDAGHVYFPSLAEWALSLGVVAAAALVFLLFVEHMRVFPVRDEEARVPRPFAVSFDSFSRVWRAALSGGLERVTLIAVVVVPIAWALMYPPYAKARQIAVQPATRLDVTRADLRIDGDRSGVFTVFPHADHQDRLGGEASCQTCHHMSLPGDQTTPCSRCHRHMLTETVIFDHTFHMQAVADSDTLRGLYPPNESCTVCHTGSSVKTAANAKPCLDCHDADTNWAVDEDTIADLIHAPGFLQAMHGKCLGCHQQEAVKQNRPALRDCSTCHPTLKPRGASDQTLAVGN
ncbi:MAG: cytochrome c3 family protein [Gemmatimonadota bacterium]